jgi:hypothetical protein
MPVMRRSFTSSAGEKNTSVEAKAAGLRHIRARIKISCIVHSTYVKLSKRTIYHNCGVYKTKFYLLKWAKQSI